MQNASSGPENVSINGVPDPVEIMYTGNSTIGHISTNSAVRHCNTSYFDPCSLCQLHDFVLASLSTQNSSYLLHIPNGKQLNKLMAFFLDEWC